MFKEGDEVLIIKGKSGPSTPSWVNNMDRFDGCVGNVVEKDGTHYYVECDNECWCYAEEWLVPFKEEEIIPLNLEQLY